MNWRRHVIEGATLIGAAILCALIANAVAGRERKMALVGTYPNATKVPAEIAPVTTTATNGAPASAGPSAVAQTATVAASSAPPTPMFAPTPAKAGVPLVTAPSPAKAGVPLVTTKAEPIVVLAQQFPPHPDKPYIEIVYDAVKQLHDQGALFLDARRTSVYEQGHIPGARSFSVWESDIDEKVNKLFEERGDPRQQAEPIVVYCSGGDCEDSHMLAKKLWGIQYNNVYVYKDGFPDWQKRGGQVHTGTAP